MPDNTEISQRVIEIVREACPSAAIDSDSPGTENLLGTGTLDSMAFISLISAIQTDFGVDIDFAEVDFEELMTVQGIVRTLAKALAGPSEDRLAA